MELFQIPGINSYFMIESIGQKAPVCQCNSDPEDHQGCDSPPIEKNIWTNPRQRKESTHKGSGFLYEDISD
jgi:hypothetical protein